MSSKTLFVFDIDGTLTDTVSMHQKAYKDALLTFGINVLNAKVKTFKHHTDSYILNEVYKMFYGIDMPDKEVKAFEEIFFEKIKAYPVLAIAGAKALIETIDNHPQFDLCFATGSLRRPAKYKLEMANLNYDNNLLETADDIYDRETIVSNAIAKAKKLNNVKQYKKIISVGDGYWDLKTAKNLGLDFIGIGLVHQPMLIQNGAETVYEDLTSIQL